MANVIYEIANNMNNDLFIYIHIPFLPKAMIPQAVRMAPGPSAAAAALAHGGEGGPPRRSRGGWPIEVRTAAPPSPADSPRPPVVPVILWRPVGSNSNRYNSP